MEKYLIAQEKNVKTSFWFCFGLFSLSENAASTSQKTVFAQEPLLSDKRNNHKTTTFYSHTHQTKKNNVMKRLILSVLTAVMIFLSADLSAQTNGFSLHIGGTMPMGSFAQSSNAFLDYGSGQAAAANGFAIGAKAQYSFPIPIVRRLKAMLTVDLLYNGMQNEAKNNLEGYGNMDGYFETSAPSYYNIPIMAGVNLSPLVLGPIKLYGEIGMGVNFRMVSDMQRVFELKASDGSTRQFAGTVSFDNAATFAFQLGIGLCFLNRVSVGLSYYNLGRTELKGSFTSFEGAGEMIGSIANEYQEFSNGKIGTDMFVVRVGLHL